MPDKTIKGVKGDWEIDVIERDPGSDTIKIKYKPKKDAKGCINIRLSQTVREDAFDGAGKKVTSSEQDMLKGRAWRTSWSRSRAILPPMRTPWVC